MSTKYDNVIVFGPTGAVGGFVAAEAGKRGAKVWLAMRDTSKEISGIRPEFEKKGDFQRVKADLTDPASVKAAVQESKAKAAFIYHVRSEDGSKGALEAMKEAGVEYVVFLSSFSIDIGNTIYGDMRKIPQSDIIAYMHAHIEINMEDLGINHTVLRPGQFASNQYMLSLDKAKQPMEAWYPFAEYRGDALAPLDIGRVGGSVLVNRPSSSLKEIISLYGPELLSQDEQWDIIKRVSGKDVKIVRPSKHEFSEFLTKTKGFPPFFASYLIAGQEDMIKNNRYTEPYYSGGVANIKKYSGYEPTSFEDFVASSSI